MDNTSVLILFASGSVFFNHVAGFDFFDEPLWKSPTLWRAYCKALHPGLQRAPVVTRTSSNLSESAYDAIPVFVSSFNNPSFLHSTLRFLHCYGANVTVFDNASDDELHAAFLDRISHYVPVERSPVNTGPRGFFTRRRVASLPKFFAYTDADLRPHPDLPPDFLHVLARITQAYPGSKAGFALDVSNAPNFVAGTYHKGKSVADWERAFWRHRLPDAAGLRDPLFKADIDTTFAVYDRDALLASPSTNSNMCEAGYEGVRVGGSFAAAHVPWLCYFPRSVSGHEWKSYYMSRGTSGSTMAGLVRASGDRFGRDMCVG